MIQGEAREQVEKALKYVPSNEEYRRANQTAALVIPIAIGIVIALIASVSVIHEHGGYFKAGIVVLLTMSISFVLAGIASHFAGKWSKK